MLVAEVLLLVAVDHHQAASQGCQASHNLQPQQSRPRRTEVCNRAPELRTRNVTVLLLDWRDQHAVSASAKSISFLGSTVLNRSIERFRDYITRPLARMQS